MLPNITIDGRLVDDPDLRFTPSGKAVANLRVAANDSKKNDDGTWDNLESIFIGVTLWESEAEAAPDAYRKGDRVLVTGRIFQRPYEKRDGTKSYSLEVKFPTVAKVQAVRRDDRPAPASAPANDPWAGVGSGGNAEPPF